MSLFGKQFDNLDRDVQSKYSRMLRIRMLAYMQALRRGYNADIKAVIIGDTPGPGRPTDPNYHHTPFYSTKNSSFWLNKQLIENGIDENKLLWYNAQLADNSYLDKVHVEDVLRYKPQFIVLGGNAEKWFKKALPNMPYVKVYHPQFAKRFKSKEQYQLIEVLKNALSSS
jgi:hypothetical protein